MLNFKHHIQLVPDGAVSFPAVYGAKYNVVSLFLCVIKKEVKSDHLIFGPLQRVPYKSTIFQ